MKLLEGALDYAGLFPPASLDMAEAVRKYAAYRRGPQRTLLGRLVVPVARLHELALAADGVLAEDPEGVWEVSVIGGADPRDDSQRIADVESRHGGGGPSLAVRSVERKVESAAEVEHLVGAYHDGGGRALYLEVAPDPRRLEAVLQAIAAAGAHAKLRTGGTSVDAFPDGAAVAGFVAACARAGVAFKATAGLHHAVCGEYPVDYGARSPRAAMHGFLNLFVGAMLLDAEKIDERELRELLDDRAPDAFGVDDASVRWREHTAGTADIVQARDRLLHSFGTCSFEEPVDELRALGVLR